MASGCSYHQKLGPQQKSFFGPFPKDESFSKVEEFWHYAIETADAGSQLALVKVQELSWSRLSAESSIGGHVTLLFEGLS